MKRFLGLFIVGFCSVLCACGSRPESRVPVIGISDFCNGGTVTVSRTYFDAVLRAGGVPVLIPLIGDEQKLDGLLQSIDGLILTSRFSTVKSPPEGDFFVSPFGYPDFFVYL